MAQSIDKEGGGSPRVVVAAVMAVLGASFFFALLSQDMGNMTSQEWADLPMGLIIRYVLSMAVGGGFAGWALAGLFGRATIGGWLLMGLGAVLVTLLAGLLGSMGGLLPDLLRDGWQTADLIPIVFGLLVIPLSMAEAPAMVLLWLVLMVAAHLLASRRRAAGTA